MGGASNAASGKTPGGRGGFLQAKAPPATRSDGTPPHKTNTAQGHRN